MTGDGAREQKIAVLRHSSDAEPGITRKRQGRYWAYYDPEGKRITSRAEIDRLNAIGLPPAYDKAWFCADPNGHMQATGVDARGRKQYRYHADFRAKRDSAKYEGLLEFGKALPKLRRRVEQDLKHRKLGRETVLAAVVRLLDKQHIRIGNEQYAKDNKSFGATTLRSRHLRRKGQGLTMRFAGKHGIVHEMKITDTNLKRICKRCQELPGQMLFQYMNGDGEPKAITSSDVNDYIREGTGGEFTAKHFRTWSASVARDQPQILCPPGPARRDHGKRARPARRDGPPARQKTPRQRRGRPARVPRQRWETEAAAQGGLIVRLPPA